ncbi:hypothetical protein L1049_017124 [Liquidambar formosana]|uniref:Uncharacterized protein n=1 Tax=Liquidambar formosana TaxID=63359 RepID=A0AAP0S0G4_LIQFO
MEVERSSKKRKQRSSSETLMGILTRSKYQMYVHCNRSGRVRSHSVHRRKPNSNPEWAERSLPGRELNPEPFDRDDEISRISIKDLRSRRIFSPASAIECCSNMEETAGIEGLDIGFQCKDQNVRDVNPNSSTVVEDCCSYKDYGNGACSDGTKTTESGENDEFQIGFSCKDQGLSGMNPNLSSTVDDCCIDEDDKISAYFDDKTPVETGWIEKFDQGFPCKAQDLVDANPNLSETEGYCRLYNAEQGSGVDGEVSNGFDGLTDECVQTTPPDADIFGKSEVDEIGDNKVECVLQTIDHDMGKPSNGSTCLSDSSVGEAFHMNIARRSDSISKSKLVLNPCSRLKVFKTPNSFSYRRLLPFLMDIAKDNSCASISTILPSKNGQCPKLEKGLEVKPLPPLLASHNQEFSSDKTSADSSPMEPHTVDSGTPQKPVLMPANSSSNGNEPGSTSSEDIIVSQISLDSQKEEALKAEQVISDRPSKLEPAHDNASPIHGTGSPLMSLCSTVNPEFLQREEGSIDVSYHPPIDAKEVRHTSGIEFTADAVSLDQVSSQPETIVPTGNLAVGLAKGILKRNPRGCRGLCTCLNCASFRLHAERAFEFSRNQMQDAEEVALDLIKELSHLRNMLEKSTNGANDHAVVQVNQVQEACRNASKAEELAKTRLSEMHCDLNIHCRITCSQKPRVRFAHYVEEKVIPKEDFSSNGPKE